ncbi:MAG: hypothetical protein IT224_04210 [Flavobacteriales bacterium]|nr:hypothetical protein [Flavobacteriales bacterium]
MRLLLTIIATCSLVFSQAQSDRPHAPLLADGYIGFGNASGFNTDLSLADWRAALPNTELLQHDIPLSNDVDHAYKDGFRDGDGPNGRYIGPASGALYLGVGLDPGRNAPEPSKFEKRLRIGLMYTKYEGVSDAWGTSETARYDTLISQATGAQFYRDTTYSEGYKLNASWSRIGLDVSYTVRRVSASRWAWYVGAGAQVGATLNNEVRVSHWISRSDLGSEEQEATYRQEEEEENHRLRSNTWGSAFALAGLDFQLSRKSSFLSSLHLFYEIRPTLQFSALVGVPTRVQGAGSSVFGMRFDLR